MCVNVGVNLCFLAGAILQPSMLMLVLNLLLTAKKRVIVLWLNGGSAEAYYIKNHQCVDRRFTVSAEQETLTQTSYPPICRFVSAWRLSWWKCVKFVFLLVKSGSWLSIRGKAAYSACSNVVI